MIFLKHRQSRCAPLSFVGSWSLHSPAQITGPKSQPRPPAPTGKRVQSLVLSGKGEMMISTCCLLPFVLKKMGAGRL